MVLESNAEKFTQYDGFFQPIIDKCADNTMGKDRFVKKHGNMYKLNYDN